MAQTLGPLKFYTVASAVLAAVQAGLTNQVTRAGVVPGAIPWDECDCGMLAVSIGKTWLSDTFPDPEMHEIGNCTAAWEVAEILIQVIRCVPVAVTPANPYPPSPALDTAAQIMAADAFQTVSAVALLMCGWKDDGTIIDYLLGEQSPMGPEGGCVGIEFSVAVGLSRG